MSLRKGCGIVALFGLLALGGIGYCGYSGFSSLKKEMPLVESEAKTWIGNYNADHFADLYRISDPLMIGTATEADFLVKMQKLKAQSGEIALGAQLGFYMQTFNGTTFVTAQYDATNDKGKRTVTFRLHSAGGWKVAGIQVQQSL